VARRAAFYGTMFACTEIPPKKEEYKLSELRTLFEVHLRYACMEHNGVFEAVLRMCTDYDSGLQWQWEPDLQTEDDNFLASSTKGTQ
jgi:hypothetical protein